MQWTRRTLLGGIASTTVPLAGCSLGSSPEGATGSGGNDRRGFNQIRVEGGAVVIELDNSSSADAVNLIAPDGSAYASSAVPAGATTVEFELDRSYPPGEYEVVASAGASRVASETLTIAPDLRITEVGIGANHPDRMPTGLNFADEQALIEITNKGSGPGIVTQLGVIGDVPNPTEEIVRGSADTSGIYDHKDGYGTFDSVPVPSGNSVAIFSTSKPFLFTSDGITCQPRAQEGNCTVIVRNRIGSEPIRATRKVQYTASEKSDSCSIELKSGGV